VPNDPYLYTNTVLLLHGDGANGSTNIVDSSRVAGSPKVVTPVGNAQISTAIADPFGNSARGVLAFDGNGDYLTVPSGLDFQFGTGDFTVEAWIRSSDLAGQKVLLDTRPNGDPLIATRWIIYTNGTALNWVVAGTNYSGGALATNTWYFVTLCRSSGSTRAFLDGVQIGSTVTDTTNYLIGASRPIIGADGNNPTLLNFNGYIDELRITKGVARYTSNFTPPTAPFPDF